MLPPYGTRYRSPVGADSISARDIGETNDISDSRGRLSLQKDIVNPSGRPCVVARVIGDTDGISGDIGKTVRVILSGVHGTGTKPNREAATSEAKSGSRTNHI